MVRGRKIAQRVGWTLSAVALVGMSLMPCTALAADAGAKLPAEKIETVKSLMSSLAAEYDSFVEKIKSRL